jgi:reactive intermediate/imine deaminase
MDASGKRFINPETIAKPTGYTHVVEARGNRTLYISGQVALDPEGNIVGPNDLQAQAEQIFLNLQAALTAANADFDNVVKLTYYFVDISQIQTVRDVRNRIFGPEQYPASTAVEVRGLARKEFLLEIEAVAVLS